MSVREFYYSSRRFVSWCCDRLGTWCDDRTIGAYAIRSQTVRRVVVALLQGTGGLAHVVKLLPRLDAYRLEGSAWRVVYVGDTLLMKELEYLLFPDGVSKTSMKRVAATGVRRFVEREVGGADLVVCALPRLWPWCWRPRAPLAFTTPIQVNATLDVRAPLADLLRGTRRMALRKQLRKMQHAGYSVRAIRSRDEFDWFYAEMYRPHVERRHGSRALVTPQEGQWRGWIVPGGSVLLVEREGRSLAGVLCRCLGSTMVLGEEGVAQTAEAEELQSCVRVAVRAAAIEQARSSGATEVIMGYSLAYCADRVLDHKLRWGSVVVPGAHSMYPAWTFLAASLPDPLREHLNRQGLISFVHGRPCVVSIGAPTEASRHAAAPIGRILVVGADSAGSVTDVGRGASSSSVPTSTTGDARPAQ